MTSKPSFLFSVFILSFFFLIIRSESDHLESAENIDTQVNEDSQKSNEEIYSSFINYLKESDVGKHNKIAFARNSIRKAGYVTKLKAVALKDIKEGETIYSFFLSSEAISLEAALNDEKVGEVFKSLRKKDAISESEGKVALFDDQIVKLYILYQKFNPNPKYAPYLNFLSSLKLENPLFWEEEELNELKGSRLYRATQNLKEDIQQEHRDIISKLSLYNPEVFPRDKFTLNEMYWIHTIFTSRHWYKSPTTVTPLFPLIEVFSYKEESSVKFVETNGVIDVIATEDIETNEEVIINDGKLGNRDLLEYFGFVTEKNDVSTLDVGLGLDSTDQLYGNKKKFLHQRELKDGQVYGITSDEIPADLFFALRVYHLTIYDIEDVSNAFKDKQVSAQNEMKVVQTLLDLCQSSLKGYKTTAKEDKELLKNKLPIRHRNAIIFRRGEKKILLRTLDKVKEMFKKVKEGWNMRTMDIPGGEELKASLNGQQIL